MRSWLDRDRAFRAFFDGETAVVPEQLRRLALARLGPFARLLPDALAAEARTGRRPERLVEHTPAARP